MTVNRTLLIIGVIIAIIGAGLVFVGNLYLSPPTDFIVAARDNIPAGTRLSDLPEDAFVA
jgi:HAMP domain-containing protein